MNRTTLCAVKPGRWVEIESVEEGYLKPKLMELGFVKGKHIRILFKAPFGDPIAVDVRGSILSLRMDEAKLIAVRELSDPNKV